MKILIPLFALLFLGTLPARAERLSVLIIDGHNNHDWRSTTDCLRATLESTGRFEVIQHVEVTDLSGVSASPESLLVEGDVLYVGTGYSAKVVAFSVRKQLETLSRYGWKNAQLLAAIYQLRMFGESRSK